MVSNSTRGQMRRKIRHCRSNLQRNLELLAQIGMTYDERKPEFSSFVAKVTALHEGMLTLIDEMERIFAESV